jgi:hypothetical protein
MDNLRKTIERVIEGSQTLSLDSEQDRKTLRERLYKALNLEESVVMNLPGT